MTRTAFIETERTALRALEDDDVEFLRRCQEPAVRAHIPILNTPTGNDGWRGYVEQTREDDTILTMLVETDEPIGEVMFRPLYRAAGRAELGLWLVPEVWGEGYGTEVTEAMLRYGFEDLRLHRITATPLARNERSRALLESLGFLEEGRSRESRYTDGSYVDEIQYAMLEDEWSDRFGENPA